MLQKYPLVVRCGYPMHALNIGDGGSFVTHADCPVLHPAKTPVSELLDFCCECPHAKKESSMKNPPGKKKKAPPPGKKVLSKSPDVTRKDPVFNTWTVVEGGMIWHGDAIDMLKDLQGESIDLSIFDPAYESLEKHRKTGTTTRLSHSKGSSNDWFPTFPNTSYSPLFKQLGRVMKKGTHSYMFSDEETRDVVLSGRKPQEGFVYDWDHPPIYEAGFKFWKSLIWNKVHAGMGYHYRASYELILMMEKVIKKNKHRQLNDKRPSDVLTFPRLKGKQYWPTEKPIELIKTLILQSSEPGDLVLDFFGGSGVVGEACLATGRKFLIGDINTTEIFKRLNTDVQGLKLGDGVFYSYTGYFCVVCDEPQVKTSSVTTCVNGHDGADSVPF